MKTGRSLTDLAAEIERQSATKRDFIVSTEAVRMTGDTPGFRLGFGDIEVGVNPMAHRQVAEYTKIPQSYYDRMRAEAPGLLMDNVNTWLHANPQKRMVRTLDGDARAFLSDRYRPLGNFDLAEAALPALATAGLDVISCELTERKLYIKAVDRSIQRYLPVGARMGDGGNNMFKIPNGHAVPAIQISNSEVGDGSLSVVGGYLDGGCTNLCWWWAQAGMRKYHVGAQLQLQDDLYRVLSDDTRRATDKAVWLQFRDTVKAALAPEVFDERLATVELTLKREMTADPVKVVEVTAKKLNLNNGQRTSVLQHLIRGGQLNQFGLANAITSAANDQQDYDEATRLEHVGGRVIELGPQEWKELAQAA